MVDAHPTAADRAHGPGTDTRSAALPPRSRALTGIRICDLSGILAGAGATRLLAAFGAEVIRVEDPTNQGRWDITRGSAPFVDERRGINLGGVFNNHNVEKFGATLDLRSEEGRELFLRLVAISDVVTENFSAGVMERLGLAYDDLRKVNEHVIYVANSGFGKTGPYSRYKTFGPVVQAVSGLTFTSGLPGQPPAGWGYSFMDHMGANFMALAILSALVKRNRTGEGSNIDMACTEAGLSLSGPELLDFTVNARPARASGTVDSNSHNFPAMAPHGIFPASVPDTWVSIACRDDADWDRLRSLMATPAADDPELRTFEGRLARREELDGLVADWTRRREASATEELVRQIEVPVAAVASPEARIEHDPATAQWGLWPTVQHTEIGQVRVDGIPIHLSDTDWVIAKGGPCLGEDNQYVYGELLGLSEDEIESLASAGVI